MLTELKTKAQELRGSRSGFAEHVRNSWLDEAQPNLIVDHGCGTGGLTEEIARLFPVSHTIGTDIKDHRSKTIESPRAEYRVVKRGSLHKELSGIDLLVLSGVAHHVPNADTPSFWSDCLSAMSPDGMVCVFDHAVSERRWRSIAERALLSTSEYFSNARGEGMACAYNFMTISALLGSMQAAGFYILNAEDVGRDFVTLPLLNSNVVVEARPG